MTFSFARTIVGAAALFCLSACATTGNKQNLIYLIKIEKGDTIAQIAKKYDTSAASIIELSGITPGTAPKVGQVLRVAPGPGGLIAGADEGKRLPGPRLARKLPAPDDDVQFTEDDIPSDDGKSARKKPHGGLLFNNSNDGASARAFFHWPVHGQLGSRFGRRNGRPHQGIDIRAKYGTDILASGPGVVSFTGTQSGYGRTVIVRHGKWKTLYGHLSDIDVSVGDHVDGASVLGQVGTSGNASGPHLHFEIRDPRDLPQDPLGLLGRSRLLSRN